MQDYHLSRVFGSGLYLPLCPAPGFPALYTAIYGLLFSLLAIAILLIYIIRYGISYLAHRNNVIIIIASICTIKVFSHEILLRKAGPRQGLHYYSLYNKYSARFSSRLSSRNSFEGIWLLSIITYKYTADTCFNLLRCQKVSGKELSGEFVSPYHIYGALLQQQLLVNVNGTIVGLLF